MLKQLKIMIKFPSCSNVKLKTFVILSYIIKIIKVILNELFVSTSIENCVVAMNESYYGVGGNVTML